MGPPRSACEAGRCCELRAALWSAAVAGNSALQAVMVKVFGRGSSAPTGDGGLGQSVLGLREDLQQHQLNRAPLQGAESGLPSARAVRVRADVRGTAR
eukprot:1963635-Pyramimonas_sp.AAC.1